MGHQPLEATHVSQGFDLYLKKKKKNRCKLNCKENLTWSDKVTITSLITAVEKLRGAKWWHTADFAQPDYIHVYLLFLQTFITF